MRKVNDSLQRRPGFMENLLRSAPVAGVRTAMRFGKNPFRVRGSSADFSASGGSTQGFKYWGPTAGSGVRAKRAQKRLIPIGNKPDTFLPGQAGCTLQRCLRSPVLYCQGLNISIYSLRQKNCNRLAHWNSLGGRKTSRPLRLDRRTQSLQGCPPPALPGGLLCAHSRDTALFLKRDPHALSLRAFQATKRMPRMEPSSFP